MDIMVLKYALIFAGMGAVYWFLDSRTRRRVAEVSGRRIDALDAKFSIAALWRACWLTLSVLATYGLSVSSIQVFSVSIVTTADKIDRWFILLIGVPLLLCILSITWCAFRIHVVIENGVMTYHDGYRTIQRRLNEILAVVAAQGIITVTCLNPKRSFRMPAGFNDNGLLIAILKNEVKGLGR